MNTRQFLETILPDNGVYVLAVGRPGRDTLFNVKCDTRADLAQAALFHDQKGSTVYHACASYADGTLPPNAGLRKVENAAFTRALWADIDVGPGKPYSSARDAGVALKLTCQQLALPMPYIVRSGRGLHIYWVYDTDIPADMAAPYHAAFAQAARNHGFGIDENITTVLASVLRPVGSHWRKEDPAREVRLHYAARPISFARIEDALRDFLVAPALPDDDEEWGLGERPYPPTSARQLIKLCPAAAEVAEARGAVSEPLWRAVIAGLVKFTVEGEALAHEWSQGDPRYSEVETQRKIDNWSKGPARCTFIEAAGGACTGCHYRGEITSPIRLGQIMADEVAVEDDAASTPPEPPRTLDDLMAFANKSPEKVPFWPKRYHWDGTVLQHAVKDEHGAVEYVPFCDRLVYPYMRYRQEDGTSALRMCADGRGPRAGRWREFDLPTQAIADATLPAQLAAYETFLIGKHGGSHMRAFLQDMIHQLEHRGLETKTINSFGWEDDGFVIGSSLISANGELPVLLGSLVPDDLRQHLGVKGEIETWVDLVDHIYNREGAEPYQFLICAAFGAPLVKLVASDLWHGIPIALTGESGLGKTTTCQVACSMYGDPARFAISAHEAGTTMTALIHRLATMRNLPLIMDELHGMRAADLPTLLYALSNGKPKLRQRQDGSPQGVGRMWDTLSFVTSNQGVNNILGTFDAHRAEATQLRVLEIALPKNFNQDVFPGINAKQLIEGDLLQQHYGAVGRKYLQFLVANRERIATRLQRMRAKFVPDDMEMTRERFYYDALASAMLGGMIAKGLGLLRFDVDRIQKWAMSHIRSLRTVRAAALPSFDDQVQSFLSSLVGRTVVTRHFPRRSQRVAPEHIDLRSLRDPIARYAVEDNLLIVTTAGLRDWCRENAIDAGRMVDRLHGHGYIRPYAELGFGAHGKLYPFRGTDLPSASTQCQVILFDLGVMEQDGAEFPATVTPLFNESPNQSPAPKATRKASA